MMKYPILIPAYNAAHTIKATLESLLALEQFDQLAAKVCILNDCSKDDTIAVVEQYWHHPSVPLEIWNNPQNMGERATVNRAVDKIVAEGYDWFFLLHADDTVKKDWLVCFSQNIQHNINNKVVSVSSSYDVIWDDGRVEPGEYKSKEGILIQGNIDTLRGTLKSGTWWHISGCAISGQYLSQVSRFKEDMPQLGDLDWVLNACVLGYNIVYIPYSLSDYFQSQHTVSSYSFRVGRDLKEHFQILSAFRQHLTFDLLVKEYVKMAKKASSRVLTSIYKYRDKDRFYNHFKYLLKIPIHFIQTALLK